MAEPTALGITKSQDARLAEMLRAYESGTLWPSERPLQTPREHQLAKVRFHNDSGEAIPAWGVMRVTGATVTGGVWRLTVSKPNAALNRVYLVNSGQSCPVSADGWGTYLWHGGHALYDTSETPAYGDEWGPQDGAWTLRKNHWGFHILGGNTGSGATSRTTAVQYVVNELVGKSDGAISIGNTGTVSIWRRNETSDAWEDSTMNLTCRALGKAVVASKYAPIGWRNGEWLIGCWET